MYCASKVCSSSKVDSDTNRWDHANTHYQILPGMVFHMFLLIMFEVNLPEIAHDKNSIKTLFYVTCLLLGASTLLWL